jgi:hypothetical protein
MNDLYRQYLILLDFYNNAISQYHSDVQLRIFLNYYSIKYNVKFDKLLNDLLDDYSLEKEVSLYNIIFKYKLRKEKLKDILK